MQPKVRSRTDRRPWFLAALVAAACLVVAACAPPTAAPGPPGPPRIGSFRVIAARTEAPVTAVLVWSISDPDGSSMTCRIDTTGDGEWDRTISPCRTIDTVIVPMTDPGERTFTLEVSDGEHEPVVAATSIEVAPGPSEPYEITLRLDPSMRPEFREAFELAAQRWQEVLVAGVPDQALQLPAGLFGWVPAFDGVVDDILIDARDVPIDGPGGILGRAGGLLIRPGAWQPYWGMMEFDTADLDSLAANGRLQDVILHEMGHVLGLGANWLLTGSLTDLLTDPSYTGPAAVAAYQELGGARWVPVEDEGQWGTVFGHWRERTFGDELMTGYLGVGAQPLSRVTVAALADLGYGVDLAAADDYSLPSPALRAHDGHDHHDHDHDEHGVDDHLHTDRIPPFTQVPAGP